MQHARARRHAILASFALASAALAQKPTVVSGVVTGISGARVAGVEMTLANSPRRVVTNDSGEFTFTNPPTGRLRLAARRLGYKPQDVDFVLDAGESRRVDFALEALPELLDSVNVRARNNDGRLAEFWNRRAHNLGVFLTREDIERKRAYRTSDLLRTVSGIRVQSSTGSDQTVVQMGRTPGTTTGRNNTTAVRTDCQVNYYVDGIYAPPGTFQIDFLQPKEIEAIEIYRGAAEIPAAFRNHETGCGLIVIWTRHAPKREPSNESLLPVA